MTVSISATRPAGYERVPSDVPWDPAYLEFVPPKRVYTIEDFSEDAAPEALISPVATTSPFRLLSDEGARILQAIMEDCKQYGWQRVADDPREAKTAMGNIYRSDYLRGMLYDSSLRDFLSDVTRVPLEPAPLHHFCFLGNYAPEDPSRGTGISGWHVDAVLFNLVMAVSDPGPMKGGRTEWFSGSLREAKEIRLDSGAELPEDQVVTVEYPGPGWAIIQQGWVVHRAGDLESPYPRVTTACQWWSPASDIDDPTDLDTFYVILNSHYGAEVALQDVSRYAALRAALKLERFAKTKTNYSLSLEDLRAALQKSVIDIEETLARFDNTRKVDSLSAFVESETERRPY